MQNRMQYYERIYKRIQDILANIGGMANSLLLLASLINNIINSYVTLLDFENIMIDSEPKLKIYKSVVKRKMQKIEKNDSKNIKKDDDFAQTKNFIRNSLITKDNNIEKKEGNENFSEKEIANKSPDLIQ